MPMERTSVLEDSNLPLMFCKVSLVIKSELLRCGVVWSAP